MADSLKDQLLKVGLITEEQARKSTEKRRPSSQQRKHKPKPRSGAKASRGGGAAANTSGEVSLSQAYAIRKKVEKQQAMEEAKRKAEDLKRRQEANRKLKQLMADASLNDKEASERRNYMYGGKIRHVYVTEQQQAAISDGQLGIVVYMGRAHIVSEETYLKVKAAKPEAAAFLATE